VRQFWLTADKAFVQLYMYFVSKDFNLQIFLRPRMTKLKLMLSHSFKLIKIVLMFT